MKPCYSYRIFLLSKKIYFLYLNFITLRSTLDVSTMKRDSIPSQGTAVGTSLQQLPKRKLLLQAEDVLYFHKSVN